MTATRNIQPRRSPLTIVGWLVGLGVPLLFLAVFFAWPVLTILGRGFFDAGRFETQGLVEVLQSARTWRVVTQTLIQAVAGTIFSVLLGIPGAYVLYRMRFPGQRILRAIVTVPFVLPSVVVGVAFRSLLMEGGWLGWMGLDGTLTGIVLALVFFNYSLVVRTVGGMWASLDPRMEQAARSLGASPARVWWHVTLPTLRPAIASAAALTFLFCATAFGVVMVLGGLRHANLESEIWYQTMQVLDLRTAAVLSVLQLLVVAIGLVMTARARASRTSVAMDTSQAPRGGAGKPAILPIIVTAVTVTGLVLTPIVNLVVRSLRTRDGWGLGNYIKLGDVDASRALNVTVWEALGNSLRSAVVATLIAVIIGGLLAMVVSRRPRSRLGKRGLELVDHLVMIPLGVSAVTVGFGFLLTIMRPIRVPLPGDMQLVVDLTSSGLLVPMAQAVVAIPIVVRVMMPTLQSIDPRLREAATALGAGPLRALMAVDGPLAARALGLSMGFAFAVSLGEFGATSFLARGDTMTLPVVIHRLISAPGQDNYGMALAASVVLAGLCAVTMALMERLRGDLQAGGF